MLKKSLVNFKGNRIHILILICFTLVIFLRFYNIAGITRFTRDESDVLRQIYDIYYHKHLTFIGPTDSTRTIIYPSLTLYLMLPFAAVFGFTPQSPAYATAFLGVLAVVVVLLIAFKVNKKLLLPMAFLSAVWFPFIESSRWAWNPHLIPFFSLLAVLFVLYEANVTAFLAGLTFGAVFQLHYISIVAFVSFLAAYAFYKFLKKDFKKPLLLGLGFFVMIIPFIIFDLKHPPGLFFGYFMQNNMVKTGFNDELVKFFSTFVKDLSLTLYYLAQTKVGAYLLGVSIIALLVYDIKRKSVNLIYFAPVLPQIASISFLPVFGNRYFIPALSFFIVWLISKRDYKRRIIAGFAILVMLFGSLLAIRKQLTQPIYEPPAGVVNEVSNFIKTSIEKGDRKNVNIAVLASPDQDPLGAIYRHTLYVKGINVLTQDQYNITDNLYVVSTSGEGEIRNDPGNIINGFRQGPIAETYELERSNWKVYLFNRY